MPPERETTALVWRRREWRSKAEQKMLMLQHEGGGGRWEVRRTHEAHRATKNVKVCEDVSVVDCMTGGWVVDWGVAKKEPGRTTSGDEFEDFEVRLRSLSFSSSA